jgi:hypothetical protein
MEYGQLLPGASAGRPRGTSVLAYVWGNFEWLAGARESEKPGV